MAAPCLKAELSERANREGLVDRWREKLKTEKPTPQDIPQLLPLFMADLALCSTVGRVRPEWHILVPYSVLWLGR